MRRNKGSVSKAQSYGEIGEFWDGHDLSEHWNQTESVEFEVERIVLERKERPQPEIPPTQPSDPAQPEQPPLPPDAPTPTAPVREPSTPAPAGDPPVAEPTRLV